MHQRIRYRDFAAMALPPSSSIAPETVPPVAETPMGATLPVSPARGSLVGGVFAEPKRLKYFQRLNLLAGTTLTVALLVTMVLYSVVVHHKTQLQNTLKETQLLNEQNNTLHVQLNQSRAFKNVATRGEMQYPHLKSRADVVTLTATQPLLTQPVLPPPAETPLQPLQGGY